MTSNRRSFQRDFETVYARYQCDRYGHARALARVPNGLRFCLRCDRPVEQLPADVYRDDAGVLRLMPLEQIA